MRESFRRSKCLVTILRILSYTILSVHCSSSIDFTTRVPKFMQPLAKRILTPYPKINTAQCVGCGKCAESCPQHTITVREHKAHIEYSKCIHCFCCHEMCPKHVINIKRFSLFDL